MLMYSRGFAGDDSQYYTIRLFSLLVGLPSFFVFVFLFDLICKDGRLARAEEDHAFHAKEHFKKINTQGKALDLW